jgi:hypothetical protein
MGICSARVASHPLWGHLHLIRSEDLIYNLQSQDFVCLQTVGGVCAKAAAISILFNCVYPRPNFVGSGK